MADNKELKTQEVEVNAEVKAAISKEEANELVAKHAEELKRRMKKFDMSGSKTDEVELEKTKKLSDVVAFGKALATGDKVELQRLSNTRSKVLVEGTTTAGGFLVPEEFERMVIRKIDDFSQIRSNATVLPMSHEVKNLRTIATDPTVAIVGENAQITASDPTFGQPVLTARKYAGITVASNELIEDEDSIPQLMDLMAERFAEKIAEKEQDEFVNGSTAGSEGILQVSGVTNTDMAAGDTSFADATFDYLNDLFTSLEGYSILESRNGKFYMSPYVWGVISQTKPTNNTYYGGNPVNGWTKQAWGREVVVLNEMPGSADDAVSTKFIAYGDLSKHLYIGDRAGITVTIGTEGTVGAANLFEDDLRAIRVIKRTANTIALPAGIQTLTTAAV